jgi:uncharacterized membrane protein
MFELAIIVRAVHVLSVLHWIGGLVFVTLVVLPSLCDAEASTRLVQFDALEHRFAGQARLSTLLAGASGFYLFYELGHWEHLAEPRFWWLHAMIALWAIFMVMLFVAEPLFLHAWFDRRARRDPDGAFRIALRGHRVLSAVAVLTTLGAVAGAHGLF